jgi:hypothetical protein
MEVHLFWESRVMFFRLCDKVMRARLISDECEQVAYSDGLRMFSKLILCLLGLDIHYLGNKSTAQSR